MNNSKTLFQDFVKRITLKESKEEIQGVAYLVFENLFGQSRTDILAGKPIHAPELQDKRLDAIVSRINNQEPVQYILEEAVFYGRKFIVNSSVLIPRPETEELVAVVPHPLPSLEATAGKPALSGAERGGVGLKLLDIGTGSGCIAITLALEIQDAEVYATDVSDDALNLARKNAENLNAKVSFIRHNILTEEIPFHDLDVIVSNPPYVTLIEKYSMKSNVVNYEPHLALFVPENDPLVFYKAIAVKANKVLRSSGRLVVEINEKYGKAVLQLFSEAGFRDVMILKDLSGKDRMASGLKP